jgi:SAM-dependent methyltransferase
MSGSVSFDRAAEYYDETRGLSEGGVRRTTAALAEAFAGAGPLLEVGVGTGQVAVPLHHAGGRVVGLDLSRAMLRRLLDKGGGEPAFPLMEADATAMPLRDGSFAGAYLRWVLHLIADWETVVREIARVVVPGGRYLAALGSYGGARSEIQSRFAEITGISTAPVGLAWEGWPALDGLVAAMGGSRLPDVTVRDRDPFDLERFVRGVEDARYSWTWSVTDDVRRAAAAEVRSWAEARWGPLDRVPRETIEVRFAAYRLA